MNFRRATISAIAMTILSAVSTSTFSQDSANFPTKPVRIIGTSMAGSSLDVLVRLIAERLAAGWKQPVIVDNKPGANGIVATTALTKAPADGYTLLTTNSSIVQTTILYPKAGYQLADLSPVSQLVLFPIVFGVRAELPVHKLQDFVALAKSKPGSLSYGSYGAGSSGHLLVESLKRAANMYVIHVPYRGETAMVTDLLGGQLEGAVGSAGNMGQYVKSGRVRLLAVASPQRLKDYPELPTFSDAGYDSVSVPGWSGLFAPANTPRDVVEKISTDVARVIAMPDISARIAALGAIAVAGTPQSLADVMARDYSVWSRTIKDSGIKVDE